MLKAQCGHDLIQKITPANGSTHPLSAHQTPGSGNGRSALHAQRRSAVFTVADAEDTQLQKPPFRL